MRVISFLANSVASWAAVARYTGSLPGLEPQNTVMDCGLEVDVDVEALGGVVDEVLVMFSRSPLCVGGKLRSGTSREHPASPFASSTRL